MAASGAVRIGLGVSPLGASGLSRITETGPVALGTPMGWLGVALTGSDTASHVLFGGLQTITTRQIGLSPVRIWRQRIPRAA